MAFILLSPDVREYLEKTPTPGLKGGGEVIVPRIENKVVVHFRDGRILKGYTYDFHPDKTVFHLIDAQKRKEVTEVSISQTKAVFFVKTFFNWQAKICGDLCPKVSLDLQAKVQDRH